jgi:hypothetical protein
MVVHAINDKAGEVPAGDETGDAGPTANGQGNDPANGLIGTPDDKTLYVTDKAPQIIQQGTAG